MARILIVDDSPTVVVATTKLLQSDGHEVERIDSLLELPSRLTVAPPDVILLDLEMPLVSGVTWGNFVRRYRAELPLIIHSSRPWKELDEAARALNAAGILPKGSPPDAVRFIVSSVLRRATRRAQP